MAFWEKKVPLQKKTEYEAKEQDQLDILRHLWLARLLEAGGDEKGAALARDYASLADAFNEAKFWYKATMDRYTGVCTSPDWQHRYLTLRAQMRNERTFWRNLQPDEMVVITDDDPIAWPTDAELLAGA